jgi:hypothetical protein
MLATCAESQCQRKIDRRRHAVVIEDDELNVRHERLERANLGKKIEMVFGKMSAAC